MNDNTRDGLSRRELMRKTGEVALVSALAGVALPHVHAAEDNTIRVALVGCGGRGTGAAGNALSTKNGPIKLVAMADVFEDRLSTSYHASPRSIRASKVDVPEDHKFIGFDAYKKAMDCLQAGRRGDPDHAAGLPLGALHLRDPEGPQRLHGEAGHASTGRRTRRMLTLGEESQEEEPEGRRRPDVPALRGPRRSCSTGSRTARSATLLMLRAYRMTGPVGYGVRRRPSPTASASCSTRSSKFHAFLWASGGCFSDFLIHNIDECCWMKDAWPVSAKGSGGRHYRGDYIDQNFDTYSVEYTFADGTKLVPRRPEHRRLRPASSPATPTARKGSAVISSNSPQSGPQCRIYKGQNFSRSDVVWAFPQPEPNPYQVEWDDLIDAIRKDKPYNEVQARRRGQPGHVDGPHGRPHRPDHHLRRDAQPRTRIRARRRQANT